MWTGWSLGTSSTKEPLPCSSHGRQWAHSGIVNSCIDMHGSRPMIAWRTEPGCALVGGIVGPPGNTALAELPPP